MLDHLPPDQRATMIRTLQDKPLLKFPAAYSLKTGKNWITVQPVDNNGMVVKYCASRHTFDTFVKYLQDNEIEHNLVEL